MELTELKTKIIESFAGSASDLEEVLQMVEEDKSIFPFNPTQRGSIGEIKAMKGNCTSQKTT